MAVKVIQVDYETGEYVDEYKSIREAAKDNWVDEILLANLLREGKGTAIMPKRQLAFKKALKPV